MVIVGFKVSRSSFNQNLTSTLAPLKSVNQIAEILSAKLEELASLFSSYHFRRAAGLGDKGFMNFEVSG